MARRLRGREGQPDVFREEDVPLLVGERHRRRRRRAKAGRCPPDALREIARAFAATTVGVASPRDAARADAGDLDVLLAQSARRRRRDVPPGDATAARGDAPAATGDAGRNTPPLALGRRPRRRDRGDRDDRLGAEKDARPIAFAVSRHADDADAADDAADARVARPVRDFAFLLGRRRHGRRDGRRRVVARRVSRRNLRRGGSDASSLRGARRPTAPDPGVSSARRGSRLRCRISSR